MPAGYSQKPLIAKLGIKENMKIFIVNNPGAEYTDELGKLPNNAMILNTLDDDLDIIHFFTTSSTELKRKLAELKGHIKPSGMIWVSWPKKSSKVKSGVDENTIRERALSIGLVDVKVCAVTEIWSGLKLVIRKENR